MSAPILPPNPCLVAILLVVKSRTGPRFVFHYPSNAGEVALHGIHRDRNDTSSASSDGDQVWSSDEGGIPLNDGRLDHAGETKGRSQRRGYKRSRYQDEDEDDRSGSDLGEKEMYGEQGQQKKPAWETVLGFGTDGLGTLLCPVRSFHKRRFEMTLDQLVFLGWPVFIREDGGWRKRRDKTRKMKSVDNSGEDTIKEEIKLADKTDLEVNEELGETSGHDTAVEESGGNVINEEVQTQDEKNATTAKRKDSMTMFNVVFVMDPPALEYQLRVREMYDNVVKKFSRALKWEQARSGYVWKESKQILKLKEKAKESSMPFMSRLVSTHH